MLLISGIIAGPSRPVALLIPATAIRRSILVKLAGNGNSAVEENTSHLTAVANTPLFSIATLKKSVIEAELFLLPLVLASDYLSASS